MMAGGKGIGASVKEVVRRASAVAKLQAELTKAELASTGKNAGIGAGLAAGAAFIAVFAFALLTTLFVVLLALAVDLWLSVLIVLVVYLALAALLGILAKNHFQQAKGPQLAKEQAQLTAKALRGQKEVPPESALTPPIAQPAAVASSPASPDSPSTSVSGGGGFGG
jgi:hypothetical protein